MVSQDQVLGQAAVGGITVHLLQFFNVPKSICPYVSGAVAFMSGIGFSVTMNGGLATGGSACFGYPSVSVLVNALGASLLQWIAQEGWYQAVAKPAPKPVIVNNPAPIAPVAPPAPVGPLGPPAQVVVQPEPPLPNVAS
jgi:hypothetical protein